ncbi:MAG: SixA phosphatase family protein [Roseimicrobium sp.]
MKYLTLIRHAKSDWQTAETDYQRPLNERGLRVAPIVGRFLAKTYLGAEGAPALLPRPDRLVTSTALRAKTTAELILPELGSPQEHLVLDARLYLATPEELLAVVRGANDSWSHVVIVGHNPGISEFASRLLRHDHLDAEMPTCGVVLMALPWECWVAVDWNEAQLVGYVTPKLIEKRFREDLDSKPTSPE